MGGKGRMGGKAERQKSKHSEDLAVALNAKTDFW